MPQVQRKLEIHLQDIGGVNMSFGKCQTTQEQVEGTNHENPEVNKGK
jgi:hypothetical protein